MIQRTFHITDYTAEKLEEVLTETAKLPEYRDSAQILLIMMEQNWKSEIIREKTAIIRQLLPKTELVGVTHFDGLVDNGITRYDIPNNTLLSFLFFEQPSFSISRISLAGRDESDIGVDLKNAVSGIADQKCLMTLFSCEHRDVETVLNSSEITCPIFGASAAVDTFFVHGEGHGIVFDSEGVYVDTLISVMFHGSHLHVRPSYHFGWTQVGKTMTITKLKDPYTIAEIDHHPAADLYGKYLGIPWQTNTLSVLNICEFPIVVERGDMRLGRIPYAWTDDGCLKLAITMHEGEKLRLSYGLPRQIFSDICSDVVGFGAFGAQAIMMVVCMNRILFLHEQERIETDKYRAVVPNAVFLHGNSEIFRNNGAGGEMHSALIAIGFREGEKTGETAPVAYHHALPSGNNAIPLEVRLMTFIRAVTGDLEETTGELLDLKEHLEDEVEKKTRENERLELHVVQTLAEAIDAKDSYTNGHSGRVAAYSREIAKRAGYSQKRQNEIYMMGLLHDVGKIGVPDAVINKPGRLTDDEFAKIKNHPVMGARILKKIREMPKLVTGARWHHERYDGRGYPDGLKGTDIPEEARIIGVADAYDAMTSNRSYRDSMPQEKVREQIESGKGTQFDPKFADIMLQMIDEDTEYKMREM